MYQWRVLLLFIWNSILHPFPNDDSESRLNRTTLYGLSYGMTFMGALFWLFPNEPFGLFLFVLVIRLVWIVAAIFTIPHLIITVKDFIHEQSIKFQEFVIENDKSKNDK